MRITVAMVQTNPYALLIAQPIDVVDIQQQKRN